MTKFKILDNQGFASLIECDKWKIEGEWLVLTVEYVESELAPIPKEKVIALFCKPAKVEVVD